MKFAAMAAFVGVAALFVGETVEAAQQEVNGVRYNFSSQRWKFDSKYLPKVVQFSSDEKPGTIIVYTRRKQLYLILGNDKAKRYGIGVGRWGFRWSGTEKDYS